MEGWRQRRLGSKEDHSTSKGNYKTDLTRTGLLMEGLGPVICLAHGLERARTSIASAFLPLFVSKPFSLSEPHVVFYRLVNSNGITG